MNLYRIILIFIIIVLFINIIWSFIKRYNLYKNNVDIKLINKEGFDVLSMFKSTPESELKSLKSKEKVKIISLNPELTNLPLKEYCIMSSYNTAITGKYVNLDMIKYVLSRGCRFLDFEVFYVKDDKENYKPVVSYVIDKYFNNLETENNILLDNVLNTAITNCFSSNSPNNKDPLFIQLRIKPKMINKNDISYLTKNIKKASLSSDLDSIIDKSYNDDVLKNEALKKDFYNSVAKSVDYVLNPNLYKGKVTKDTKMKDLMGKVVLIIDKSTNYDYVKYCNCKANDKNCYDLTKYINMETGSSDLFLLNYNEILNQYPDRLVINNNNNNNNSNIISTTNVKDLYLIMPDNNTIKKYISTPDMKNFVLNYGCQIIPYKFYNKDIKLSEYELFFNNNKIALVPMSITLKYLIKTTIENDDD
jgi:hypothetical protein